MTAPDLVLLHGALGASAQLDPLAALLRPRFRVHQLDFEGHGGAPPRDRPYRMHHFAGTVVEALDAAGVDRACLFGYSMGGYVAGQVALAHPHRVVALATLGTKYRWDPATAAREVSRLDPAAIRAKVPRFAETLAARHAGAGGWEAVLARTADLLRDLGDHPALTDDALPLVRQPARVIVGERDATVSVEESAAVARRFGAGSLTVLPDAPHPIEQVDAAALAAVLLDFFPHPAATA